MTDYREPSARSDERMVEQEKDLLLGCGREDGHGHWLGSGSQKLWICWTQWRSAKRNSRNDENVSTSNFLGDVRLALFPGTTRAHHRDRVEVCSTHLISL